MVLNIGLNDGRDPDDSCVLLIIFSKKVFQVVITLNNNFVQNGKRKCQMLYLHC